MKQVKTTQIIVEYQSTSDGITWAEFLSVIMGKELIDSDIVQCGPSYSCSYECEKELDGYFINITRNIYETDEEQAEREKKEIEGKAAYQKMLADRAMEEHNRAMAEHERLKALFNPIPKR